MCASRVDILTEVHPSVVVWSGRCGRAGQFRGCGLRGWHGRCGGCGGCGGCADCIDGRDGQMVSIVPSVSVS